MDISQFDVYIVMQIDAIKMAIQVVILLVAFCCLIAACTEAENIGKLKKENDRKRANLVNLEPMSGGNKDISYRFFKTALFGFILSFLCLFSTALIPNGNTLAAMKIVPALSSNEFLCKTAPKDAKQVYSLAIEALQNKLKESVK